MHKLHCGHNLEESLHATVFTISGDYDQIQTFELNETINLTIREFWLGWTTFSGICDRIWRLSQTSGCAMTISLTKRRFTPSTWICDLILLRYRNIIRRHRLGMITYDIHIFRGRFQLHYAWSGQSSDLLNQFYLISFTSKNWVEYIWWFEDKFA